MLLEDKIKKIAEDHLRTLGRWPVYYKLKPQYGDEADQLRVKFGVPPKNPASSYDIHFDYNTSAGKKIGFFSIDALTGNILSGGEQG